VKKRTTAATGADNVVAIAQRTAEQDGLIFRMERKMGVDYSRARPQTAGRDAGSTDANIALSMAIPAVAVGANAERLPHRLEENTDAGSIVPGIKSLVALAVALTSQ